MDPALQALIVAFGGFLAGSGGFWVYLKTKYENKDCIEKLIMGLAHDKIVELGIKYIEKGFVTKDEYDDLFKYFWEPYHSVGGNGSAERIIGMVMLLPLTPERRGDPKVREAAEKLITGAQNVVKQVEEGSEEFERSPKYDRGG